MDRKLIIVSVFLIALVLTIGLTGGNVFGAGQPSWSKTCEGAVTAEKIGGEWSISCQGGGKSILKVIRGDVITQITAGDPTPFPRDATTEAIFADPTSVIYPLPTGDVYPGIDPTAIPYPQPTIDPCEYPSATGCK